MDAAIANTSADDISILLGNGDGSFAAPVEYSVGNFPASISTADFNGDGNSDLAVVNHLDSTMSILLGKADGTFQTPVTYAAGTLFAIIKDFDGDGKIDIATIGVASDGTTTQLSILPGNGDGTFRTALNSPVPGSGGNGIALADFDQDGKSDFVIINYDSSNAVIMLGNGDGTFRVAPALVSVPNPNSVAAEDFNGDGKADFAVADASSNKLHIFVGNGDGSFQPLAQQYEIGDAAFAMEAADLNGDAIVDLAVVSANYHYVSILEGNGNGTFKPATNYGVSKGPTGLAVADFNGDGKPDLITTGFWLEKVSTLMNTTRSALPVQLLSAVSRKVHGTAGSYDVDLPVNGSGIECRSGGDNGDYTVVFTFANPLTRVAGVSVTSGTGSIGSSAIGTDAHQYVVNLTGVANAQRLGITLEQCLR